jgi:hypothetical protein
MPRQRLETIVKPLFVIPAKAEIYIDPESSSG